MEKDLRTTDESPISYDAFTHNPTEDLRTKIESYVQCTYEFDGEVIKLIRFKDVRYANQVTLALELARNRALNDRSTPKIITNIGIGQQTANSTRTVRVRELSPFFAIDLSAKEEGENLTPHIVIMRAKGATDAEFQEAMKYQVGEMEYILDVFKVPRLELE